MKVAAGDRIVVHGQHVGDAERHGEVLEVRGGGPSESWRIRWDRDGHEGLLFPGPDIALENRRPSGVPGRATR